MKRAQAEPVETRPRVNPSNGAACLLTADELGVRWQVPRTQVYRLSREGQLPTVRIGRYFRYSLAAVEAFEASGGVGSDD